MPKIAPNNVAKVPMAKPTKKNIFLIDLFVTPKDLNIAISLDLFFTKIVNPEIILKAATITINDKIMNRHIGAISKASTPIIFYWYNKFVCYYQGKVYKHPGGYTVGHAFIMWCTILRKMCGGKCYDSMDFSTVCEQLLDKAEVVNNDRIIEGFFTLEED